MQWTVQVGDEFLLEFQELHPGVQTEIAALSLWLEQFGPRLGRPRVDTLNDSKHANMKELRFSAADGEWRASLSPSTRSARPSCLWPAISAAPANKSSTAILSARRTVGSMRICGDWKNSKREGDRYANRYS
jgi:hypothetical protein